MPSCSDTGSRDDILIDEGVLVISFGYYQWELSLFYFVSFVVVVEGLCASVSCDFDDIWAFNVCFLQLADCCFLAMWFVNFFSVSSREVPVSIAFIMLLVAFFSHMLTSVVVQLLISFDTKVSTAWISLVSPARFLLFCCRFLSHHSKFSRNLGRVVLYCVRFFLAKFWVVLSLFHQKLCEVGRKNTELTSYHILTSSVIYYWTEARQLGIYLLNITCFIFEDFYLCSRYSNVNYCAWHFTKPLLACSEISFSINERKARKKSRKRSDIVRFGRWRDSFSSVLCSILS